MCYFVISLYLNSIPWFLCAASCRASGRCWTCAYRLQQLRHLCTATFCPASSNGLRIGCDMLGSLCESSGATTEMCVHARMYLPHTLSVQSRSVLLVVPWAMLFSHWAISRQCGIVETWQFKSDESQTCFWILTRPAYCWKCIRNVITSLAQAFWWALRLLIINQINGPLAHLQLAPTCGFSLSAFKTSLGPKFGRPRSFSRPFKTFGCLARLAHRLSLLWTLVWLLGRTASPTLSFLNQQDENGWNIWCLKYEKARILIHFRIHCFLTSLFKPRAQIWIAIHLWKYLGAIPFGKSSQFIHPVQIGPTSPCPSLFPVLLPLAPFFPLFRFLFGFVFVACGTKSLQILQAT